MRWKREYLTKQTQEWVVDAPPPPGVEGADLDEWIINNGRCVDEATEFLEDEQLTYGPVLTPRESQREAVQDVLARMREQYEAVPQLDVRPMAYSLLRYAEALERACGNFDLLETSAVSRGEVATANMRDMIREVAHQELVDGELA
jgi:hypothetical protein